MTVKDITDKALVLIGAVNQQGVIDENRNQDYYAMAPALLVSIQEELSIHEGIDLLENDMETLDDSLEISDKSCKLCATYLLAFHFANIDGNTTIANNYFDIYTKNLKYINRPQRHIQDIYGS